MQVHGNLVMINGCIYIPLFQLCDYGVVVNCSGIGAKQLVGDTELKPIRGQVLRVCYQ